jgi:uncharacterized membrane protein YfcA
MPQDGFQYALLFAAGLAAGTLNVLAGGGSFLTLPLLILMGLPPTLANGTNRVGILVQNIGAVWSFRRHGLLERRWLFTAALPAAAGAVAGTLIALWIEGETFKRILAFLMVAVTLWTLWDPLRPRDGAKDRQAPRIGAASIGAGFLLAGIYGGFVQAGVGFFLLTVSTLAGYDLVRGNALKVFCVLVFTPVSLGLFAWQGQVAWVYGLTLGAGTILGGMLGVHLTVLKGHRWVRGVVTITVIALALKLWFSG